MNLLIRNGSVIILILLSLVDISFEARDKSQRGNPNPSTTKRTSSARGTRPKKAPSVRSSGKSPKTAENSSPVQPLKSETASQKKSLQNQGPGPRSRSRVRNERSPKVTENFPAGQTSTAAEKGLPGKNSPSPDKSPDRAGWGKGLPEDLVRVCGPWVDNRYQRDVIDVNKGIEHDNDDDGDENDGVPDIGLMVDGPDTFSFFDPELHDFFDFPRKDIKLNKVYEVTALVPRFSNFTHMKFTFESKGLESPELTAKFGTLDPKTNKFNGLQKKVFVLKRV